MRNFSNEDVAPMFKSIKVQNTGILYDVWCLNYHMNTQRSEVMMMTPLERRYWIDELVKQRDKENEAVKKAHKR